MRNILIKDVMTPIEDYVTIRENQTLFDLFQMLESNRIDFGSVHRDLIVLSEDGDFRGKVTMMDVFQALEPNYKKLNKSYTDGTLEKETVMKAIKDFDLWLAPVSDLCDRASGITISEIMHVPEQSEYIQETDSLEKALHQYVMGALPPLIVKQDKVVTGILSLEDLYQVIQKHMQTCAVA